MPRKAVFLDRDGTLVEEAGYLDRLERLIENQSRFGDAIHDLLDALNMGEDRSTESDEEEGEEGEDRRKEESGDDGEGADADDTQTRVDEADVAGEDMADSTAEAAGTFEVTK